MRKFVTGLANKNVIFKIMNYLFLNTNFALVVTFTVLLSATIKRLTRYKQKRVLAPMLEDKSMPSNKAANANHTTLLKKVPKNISLRSVSSQISGVR